MEDFHQNTETILKSNPEQTFIGIWFHDDNITDEQKNQMEIYLHQTFYYYRIFDNMEQFSSYMYKTQHVAKIFLIISISNLSLYPLVNLVQEYSIIEKAYTFLPIRTVKPLEIDTNNIDVLFEKISNNIKHFSKKTNINMEMNTKSQSLNISRINQVSTSSNKFMSKSNRITPIRHLAEESMEFLSFLTMVKILLDISYDNNDIEDMWRVYRILYMENSIELKNIKDLSKSYNSENAINYYTKSSCFFKIINQACRTENVQHICEFRVYISDLDKQLSARSIEQEKNGIKSSITKVYRGKVLSSSILQQLIDNEHGLISMNGFLSTTALSEIADIYSSIEGKIDEGYIRVRFILIIDTIEQPYAYIGDCSAVPAESEILFSLGTIWRIESIKPGEKFYEIELTSYNNLNSYLDTLLKNYKKKEYDLSLVGDILRELGNYEEAEWFYQKMFKQDDLSDESRVYLYYNMAMMRKELGCNSGAIQYFQEAARRLQSSITKSNGIRSSREIYICDKESILIAVYNNIGLVHEKNIGFNEAIKCYNQAIEIENGSKLEVAIVYNNLGLIYCRYGNYQQAWNYLTKAVELADETDSCWGELKQNLTYVENITNS
ncbi:unnamed protein product [Adineta steineri]|uniref:Tetratricopeptide repeat protein n=1 Tax=Adineta steineri TaxID=433720 RepID=A0A819ERQ2_9BILA|nr:unnamed protein product [Adineta steineri]